MKLERLPEYFISFIIILLGLAIALYVGLNAGSGSLKSIVLIVGGLCFLIIGAVMGRYVWLLIPLSLYGPSRILELPIGMMEAATLTAFVWWVIFAAFRKVPFRTPTNAGDILLFLNVCYLVMTFARHPVGGLLIDSERIGGRPYFSIIFACMAYWVLSRVDLDTIWARRVPWLTVIGSLPALAAAVITRLVPSSSPFFAYVLGVGAPADDGGAAASAAGPENEVDRAGFLAQPTLTGMTTLFARFPAKTFINPLYIWRVALLCIGLVLIMLTGFRSVVLLLGVYFLLIAWYQRGMGAVIRTSLVALPVAALLIAGHGSFYRFPAAAQRSLSFLPGNWDATAAEGADDSIQWRLNMWEMVLSDDKYIENRWLGDGFGYPVEKFHALLYSMMMERDRESSYLFFIMTGTLHSGPLSLIRFVGYIGGALFYCLLIYVAVSAHRLIRRTMGTPYQFAGLAYGVPIVALPAFFTFVYGGLETDFPKVAISLGLLNMIRRGFDRYQREEKAKELEKALSGATTDGESPAPALA